MIYLLFLWIIWCLIWTTIVLVHEVEHSDDPQSPLALTIRKYPILSRVVCLLTMGFVFILIQGGVWGYEALEWLTKKKD